MSHLGIKRIIAVASGKGGVGKSTVAVNLALALAKSGASVGIMDADIYGPSQPTMLGVGQQRPEIKDGVLEPIERHGIKSMSMGYLIDATAPVVWRGPMLGKAMQQLLQDCNWGQLDYLVVDLPPGTGDIQISLCQKVPLSGAIIVTTPQDMALLDVRRACEMFKKMNVPIFGVVENMSTYHCPKCGHAESLFGAGGGAKIASEYDTVMLGAIPLAIQIREMTDSGVPPVVQAPDGEYARAFKDVATKVVDIVNKLPKNYAAKFPKIMVEGKEQE